jgi:hypothetical protein
MESTPIEDRGDGGPVTASDPNADLPGRTVYERATYQALLDHRTAALKLAAVLHAYEQFYDFPLAEIREGRILEMICANRAGKGRDTMTEAVTAHERARHECRVALVAVALDNGMAVTDIGKALQFSRQLAGRYAREARDRWPALT